MESLSDLNFQTCPNCGTENPLNAKYCLNCGQKTGRIIPSFFELIREFVDVTFSLDSKIFQTIGNLFIPGKLTTAYFQGKKKRFFHPLRLFLLMGVFNFAAMGFLGPTFNWNSEDIGNLSKGFAENAYDQIYRNKYDSLSREVLQEFSGHEEIEQAMDSLRLRFQFSNKDSLGMRYPIWRDSLEWQKLKLQRRDIALLSPDSIVTKYQIEKGFSRLFVKQSVKIMKEGGSLASFVFGKLIWMALLMMPVLAVILKLMYIRRKRFFVEHLFFSFHYHAFAFLIFGLGFILLKIIGGSTAPYVLGGASLISLFYLYKAMRKFYGQRRFKTIVKFLALNFFYVILFFVAFLLLVLIGALLF